MSERVLLAQVVLELLRQKLVVAPPKYRNVYHAALDGRIPAEQGRNGRWSVARHDLQLIAATLSDNAT